MEEYVEVKNNQFQLLKSGDYIRWKMEDGTMSAGGAVKRVGRGKSGLFWTMSGFGGREYVLSWETVESVWVRKGALYEILEKRINILSQTISLIVRELELEDQFDDLKQKLQKTGKIEDMLKTKRVREKRRGKSVPAKKKELPKN